MKTAPAVLSPAVTAVAPPDRNSATFAPAPNLSATPSPQATTNGPIAPPRPCAEPPPMLPSHRELFEIPRHVAYFNNGSFTPLPRLVRQAGEAGVAEKSTPWLRDEAAIRERADAVRAAASSFIGATADDIALVPSVAYGIATAAANLAIGPATRILLLEGEFPSQSQEWARLAELRGATLDVVPRPGDGDWTSAIQARIDAPGLPPVGIAALTPLLWTDGSLIDLDRLTPSLRAQGAAIVIDGTQAAGILPIDVRRLDADYVAFPTYKWLLGPYTLAFLYVAARHQQGTPLEQHSFNRVANGFRGVLEPLVPTARRFDMGERFNPVSLPMALAGMRLLQSWDRVAVEARLRATTTDLANYALACGLQPVDPRFRAPHLLGVRALGRNLPALISALEQQNVFVAERGGNLRIGTHIYNDEEDVARFGDALRRALQVV